MATDETPQVQAFPHDPATVLDPAIMIEVAPGVLAGADPADPAALPDQEFIDPKTALPIGSAPAVVVEPETAPAAGVDPTGETVQVEAPAAQAAS